MTKINQLKDRKGIIILHKDIEARNNTNSKIYLIDTIIFKIILLNNNLTLMFVIILVEDHQNLKDLVL